MSQRMRRSWRIRGQRGNGRGNDDRRLSETLPSTSSQGALFRQETFVGAPIFKLHRQGRVRQIREVHEQGQELEERLVHEQEEFHQEQQVKQEIENEKGKSKTEHLLPLNATWGHMAVMYEPDETVIFDKISLSDAPYIDIYTAVCLGEINLVRLMANGNSADVFQAKNKSGWSAFMYACYYDNSEIVEILLSIGVSKYDFTLECTTPLMFTAANGNLLLLSRILDINLIDFADKRGWTALFFAISRKQEEVVRYLLQHGANPHTISTDNGYSALMLAAGVGKISIVSTLLQAGADPKVVAWNGETAVTIAYTKGYFEIVRMLSAFVRPCEIPLVSLESFLTSLDLQELMPYFRRRNIGIEKFFTLTEDNLRDIGIRQIGKRKKLILVISQWQHNRLQQVNHGHMCYSCRIRYM